MNFRAPTSHLEFRHPGCLHPMSSSPAGYRQAPLQTTNHSKTHHVPHPRSHPRDWGWEAGEKAGLSGNSRPRLPKPRAPAGTQPPPPRGREQMCHCDNHGGGSVWGRARGGTSTGPGARAGGRGRAQGAAGPRLTLQEYATTSQSMNLPAPPSWGCARAHGSTHNSLISTILPEHLHSCRRYHHRFHLRRRYRHLLRLRGPASLTTEPPQRLRVHSLPPRRIASARAKG